MLLKKFPPTISFFRPFSTSSPIRENLTARYHQHGSPDKVLKLEKIPLDVVEKKKVRLKFLASPINPADINMVEGVYRILPDVPAIGGNEGVAVVEETGAEVKNIQVNDWVIPARPGLGTWQKYAVWDEDQVDKLPNDISVEAAATISVNPCTAFRMLKDFVDLKPGDVILQNGANSGVGQFVIQLAKLWGFKSINIIRNRPDLEPLIAQLRELGADVVLTDEVLNKKNLLDEELNKAGLLNTKARLALNCVSGKLAGDMTRLLADHATMVTYGGMSKQPLMIPTTAFIFKDIIFKGFWLSKWSETHSRDERQKMLEEIAHFLRDKKLKTNVIKKNFETDFMDAINIATSSGKQAKVLLTMDEK